MYWETAISTQIGTHGHFKVFNEQNESLEPSSTDSSQVSWNNCALFRISYPAAIGRARQAQQGATGLALLEEGRGEAMLPVHKTLPRLHAQLRRETAPPQGDTGTAFFKYFLKFSLTHVWPQFLLAARRRLIPHWLHSHRGDRRRGWRM